MPGNKYFLNDFIIQKYSIIINYVNISLPAAMMTCDFFMLGGAYNFGRLREDVISVNRRKSTATANTQNHAVSFGSRRIGAVPSSITFGRIRGR